MSNPSLKLVYMDAIHDGGSGYPPELSHIHPVTVLLSTVVEP